MIDISLVSDEAGMYFNSPQDYEWRQSLRSSANDEASAPSSQDATARRHTHRSRHNNGRSGSL